MCDSNKEIPLIQRIHSFIDIDLLSGGEYIWGVMKEWDEFEVLNAIKFDQILSALICKKEIILL